MKCPHCGVYDENKVLETRRFGGDIYRRRRCLVCDRFFVSTEVTAPGMTMPAEIIAARKRRTAELKEAANEAGSAGAELQNVWGKSACSTA